MSDNEAAIDLEIRAVLTGKVQAFGPDGVPSAIAKNAVSGAVAFDEFGLVSDEQGDLSVHGGVDKALHHYPFEYYERWRALLAAASAGKHPNLSHPGAFGENLSTLGLQTGDVCVGDIFELGSGVVQVSQGRTPCWKLNERFQTPSMVKMVISSGMTGWYYRVLQPGAVQSGDRLVLKERMAAAWPLMRLAALMSDRSFDLELVEEVAGFPFLSESWRQKLLKRLAKGSERREP
ncbi:MAG: MOSC domain-containing protein [Rhodomicrobium sp.]|nr:MAG: MOSC domain-containing protein [Rhodomicrobium sp.]